MNSVCLCGRLTTTPELRYTQDERAYSKVTIAVDRGISKEDKEAGKQSADFVTCVFWNGNAETLTKYVKKGHQIAVLGALRTGSYEKARENIDCFLSGGIYYNPNNNEKYIEYNGFINEYKNSKFIETIGEYEYSSSQANDSDTEDGSSINSLVKNKKKRIIIFTKIN